MCAYKVVEQGSREWTEVIDFLSQLLQFFITRSITSLRSVCIKLQQFEYYKEEKEKSNTSVKITLTKFKIWRLKIQRKH